MRAAHPANVGGDGGDRLKSLIPGSVDRLGRELKRTTATSRKRRAHCLGNSPSRSARPASSSNSGGDSSRPARKWSRITSAQQRPTVAALVGVLREFAYEGKPPGRSWPVLAVSRSERGEMLGLPQNALAQGRDKLAEHRVGAALPLDRENCAVRRCLSQRNSGDGFVRTVAEPAPPRRRPSPQPVRARGRSYGFERRSSGWCWILVLLALPWRRGFGPASLRADPRRVQEHGT